MEFRKVDKAVIVDQQRREERRPGSLTFRKVEDHQRSKLPVGTVLSWQIKSRIGIVTESNEDGYTHLEASNGDPWMYFETSRLMQRIASGEATIENPYIVLEALALQFGMKGNRELAIRLRNLIAEYGTRTI